MSHVQAAQPEAAPAANVPAVPLIPAQPAQPNFPVIVQSLDTLSQEVDLVPNTPVIGLQEQLDQILQLIKQIQASVTASQNNLPIQPHNTIVSSYHDVSLHPPIPRSRNEI